MCKALNACTICNSFLFPTAATYPIDLTRTRLQIQKHQLGSANYRGALQTVAGVGTYVTFSEEFVTAYSRVYIILHIGMLVSILHICITDEGSRRLPKRLDNCDFSG